jgi:hypothetical protein
MSVMFVVASFGKYISTTTKIYKLPCEGDGGKSPIFRERIGTIIWFPSDLGGLRGKWDQGNSLESEK